MDYRSAGVDIDAATRAVGKIRELARSTFRPEVLSDIGSFGGLFRLDTARYRRPVLVASTDGVGTKLKIAIAAGRNDSVGYDLVSHCINDILVQGARPLFFLDYLAMGKLDTEVAASVISGMAEACREFGLALLGGETAEMPGFYQPGDYDIAGTIVGRGRGGSDSRRLARSRRATGSSLSNPGDFIPTAIPSRGRSSSSRRASRPKATSPRSVAPSPTCFSRGTAAISESSSRSSTPRSSTRWPTSPAAASPTTSPACCPKGSACASISRALKPQPVFRYMMEKGAVPQDDMLRTFNLGVGMVLMVAAEDVDRVPGGWIIGEVVAGAGVSYEGSF